MSGKSLDQQPIARTVGKRVQESIGVPPSPQARAAWDALATGRTRVPKGVYRYADHEAMTRDWERWTIAGIVERTGSRG